MNRCRSTGVVVAFVLLLATPRPATAQTSADTAAILSTVQSLFDAMLARDDGREREGIARELDAERDGTKPVEFERDRAELSALLRRVALADTLPEHPLWGRMSRGMTGRYVWRHTDHHLRQFGA